MPKDKNKYYVSLEELYLDNYELMLTIIGHGAEQSTGTTYAKVSNGLYVQWSNIDYYYLLAGEGLLLTRIEFEYKSGSSWVTGGLGIRYDG